MSEHHATVRWEKATANFEYDTYNREHSWKFDGGIEVKASAAPLYRGKPEYVDPEEALVAAISSCHMLTFLSIAAKKRLIVEAYEDYASGHMEKNEEGRLAVTRAVLRPKIRFAGMWPDDEAIAKLHEQAHKECFIANSVRTQITVEPA